ncbi:hypothetical protein V8C42DRAFT_357484 [Trichoderma barbatum]
MKGKTEAGKTIVSTAYVGFGSYMQGPVFARKQRMRPTAKRKKVSSSDDSDADLEDGRSKETEDPEVFKFNMRGVLFKNEPWSLLVGQSFIPNYLMTSPANFLAVKRLVAGEALEDVCTEENNLKAYKSSINLLKCNLKRGGPLTSHSFHKVHWGRNPLSEEKAKLDAQAHDPTETTCNAALLTRGDDKLAGFQYWVPYIEVLQYPRKLITMLEEFATSYPKDVLPIRSLLLACHLWVDIMDHENMMMEQFAKPSKQNKNTGIQVPMVSLAQFLIYFPHWIKWTEFMGLSEFPHPFRFVSTAADSDFKNGIIGAGPESIKQREIYSLMKQVMTTVPSIEITQRVHIMPHMMPGTRMPPMFGPYSPTPISQIPMALTGLVNVFYYGLRDYSRPKQMDGDLTPFQKYIENPERLVKVVLPDFASMDCVLGPGKPCNKAASRNIGTDQVFPYWMPNVAHEPQRVTAAVTATAAAAAATEAAEKEEEAASEPDYKKYASLMELWRAVPRGTHVSWTEGLQAAEDLPVGKRSLTEIRRLVSAATDGENSDIKYLETKIRIMSKWHPITKDEINQNLPLAFGRLLGLEAPDTPTENAWADYFQVVAFMQQLSPASDYVSDMLDLLHVRQHSTSAGSEAVKRELTKLLAKFRDCMRAEQYQQWRDRWTTSFLELL